MNIAHEAILCGSLEKKQTIIDEAIINFSSSQTEITQMQNESSQQPSEHERSCDVKLADFRRFFLTVKKLCLVSFPL